MEDYSKYSDEELVKMIQDGNTAIMDYIFSKYKPLVRKRANTLYLIGGDNDDLIQEGMIGLFKAIQDYQTNRDASFYHFADICISRQMYTAVEASRRKKHAPLNTYVSLYEDSGEGGMMLADVLTGEADKNPERMLIDRENLHQKLQKFSEGLSKMEKQVFQYAIEGMDYRQIAEKMEKSPKAIDNALQRIKAKFEKNEQHS